MSKIPFSFFCIPQHFAESHLFDDENRFKFVCWAFSVCRAVPHKKIIKGREILLAPYEFLCSRGADAKKCFLTEKEFRGQLIWLQNSGYLQKGANSRANSFTTYIWSTDLFITNEGQLKGRQRANPGPTQGQPTQEKIDVHTYIEKEEERIVCSGEPDLKNSKQLTGANFCEIRLASGEIYKLRADEIFTHAVQHSKDWTAPEITHAWEIIAKCKEPITCWKSYVSGTIERFRTREKSQQIAKFKEAKKCTEQKQKLKEEPKSSKPNISDPDMQMRPFLSYLSPQQQRKLLGPS